MIFTRAFLKRFRRNEEGATALEYGLLVALIAIAIMLGIGQVYTAMNDMFIRMDNSVEAVNTKAETTTP